jgi:glycosyltransferase involved in cell wall biosynthesis
MALPLENWGGRSQSRRVIALTKCFHEEVDLRLAVFTHHFPSRAGGTYFARDMRALLDSGIDIDVFSFYPAQLSRWGDVPEILNKDILPPDRVHHVSLTSSLASLRPWPARKFGRFLRDTGSITVSALRFGAAPLVKSMYVYPKAWAWAKEYVSDYDHVLAYWGNYAGSCAYLFHRLLDRSIPFSTFLHAIDLYQDQVFLRQKLMYADNIIVVCDYNRQFLKENFSTIYESIEPKIYKYHLGLNLDEFPFEPNSRPKHKVLGVGSFEPVAAGSSETVKGFEYLLRAVHELDRNGIDIELELIGEGELEQDLKTLARKLAIDQKTVFRGWVPFDAVRTAMKQASVLALPSLGDAVPTAIKEAMALGTPVLASHVGGIPELLDNGRCGILVPPRNVSALVAGLTMLFENQALRNRYVYAARKYAEEQFDLWRNGRLLANLLSSTNRLQLKKSPVLGTHTKRALHLL